MQPRRKDIDVQYMEHDRDGPSDEASRHFHKVKEREEIKGALDEELEDCPSCDFAMIVPFTIRELSVFYCMGCGINTCRRCKKVFTYRLLSFAQY